MWDHIKCKHSFQMADDKKSVKQKFGSVMKQSKLNRVKIELRSSGDQGPGQVTRIRVRGE